MILANIGLLKNRCQCCQSFCYGAEKVEKRIIRFEDNMWRIRTDVGELPQSERSALIEYFDEIRLPYRLIGDYPCIIGEIDRETVFERMEHFYDGRAEVFPF